jgi:hypothetical protein
MGRRVVKSEAGRVSYVSVVSNHPRTRLQTFTACAPRVFHSKIAGALEAKSVG